MIIGAFLPELATQQSERQKLARLNEQITAERHLLLRNQRQVNFLTNSPEYVEAIARDRFDRMKEGETIYRFDDGKSKPALAPVVPTAPKRLN